MTSKNVRALAKKWEVFHFDCQSINHLDIESIFDLIIQDAVGQLYAQPKIEHQQQDVRFPFFKNNFISQKAGLEFAKTVAWITRGHLQKQDASHDASCILSQLPLEMLEDILQKAGQSILKDPSNPDNQKNLEKLHRLVYANANSAEASTGQEMVWGRGSFFTPGSKDPKEIYPSEEPEVQENKKNGRCMIC